MPPLVLLPLACPTVVAFVAIRRSTKEKVKYISRLDVQVVVVEAWILSIRRSTPNAAYIARYRLALCCLEQFLLRRDHRRRLVPVHSVSV